MAGNFTNDLLARNYHSKLDSLNQFTIKLIKILEPLF